MTFKEIYCNFIYGLLQGTVEIKKTATTGNVFGNMHEAKKGKVPFRVCALYYVESSKGWYIEFIFKGETLDEIWKFKKNTLDPLELLRININNCAFDHLIDMHYGP